MIRDLKRTRRWLGLRGKLVGVITIPMIALNSLAVAVFTHSRIEQTTQSLIWNTQSIIRAVTQDFERLYLSGDQHLAADVVDRLRQFERVEQAVAYDSAGGVIFAYARTGFPRVGEAPPIGAASARDGRAMTIVEPLASKGRAFGVAAFDVSTVELQVQVAHAIATTILVGLFTAALGLVIACLLQRVISRPVLELKATAQAVTDDADYSLRAIRRTSDEIGDLTDAFNDMLSRIEQGNEALRQANDELEDRVAERTSDLQEANQSLTQEIADHQQTQRERERLYRELMQSSRQAGMAEVATGILHNVGNVLNSVNVSANLLFDRLDSSSVDSLNKGADLLDRHRENLREFVTQDERGKQFAAFLKQLATRISSERQSQQLELRSLIENVQHVSEIINMQQSYATLGGMKEPVQLADVIEDALKINDSGLHRHGVELMRQFQDVPAVVTERHKVLQILVNLISNAKYALSASASDDKRMTISLTSDEETVRIVVGDNGVGIARENLTKIFAHGFTTKKEGRGFGLHSSALAAKEMGGQLTVASDGLGRGATFTLAIPLVSTDQGKQAPATLVAAPANAVSSTAAQEYIEMNA